MISPLRKLLRLVKRWYWDLWFNTDAFYDNENGGK